MTIIFGWFNFESGHPISNPIGWLMNYVFRSKHNSVIISTMIDDLKSNWVMGKKTFGHWIFLLPLFTFVSIKSGLYQKVGPVSLTESRIYGLLQFIVRPLECRRPTYVNYLIFSVLFVIRKILLAKSLSGVNNFCLVSDILSGFECERLRIGTISSLTWSSKTFIFWMYPISVNKLWAKPSTYRN